MSQAQHFTYEAIEPGDSRVVQHTVSRDEVELLSLVSGDVNPFASHGGHEGQGTCREPVCEGVSAEALVHGILKRQLPGPGTVVVEHQLTYAGTARAGDELIATVTAVEKLPPDRVVFDCQVRRGEDILLSGLVTVRTPQQPVPVDQRDTPDILLRRHDVFGRLFRSCEQQPPVPCAVVHPCDAASLGGALEAARLGLIAPTLVGPSPKIQAVATAEGWDISPFPMVDTEHSHAAAAAAVTLVREGQAKALMKGSLHTDELMAAVVAAGVGLRTGRRISHVFVLDVPAYPRMLMVTDAAINIAPSIKDKVDIVQNAIDLAHVLGVEKPRVAVLAAVETVNPDMPATIDAAMLSKMTDRGQITGAWVDGPLAFDNAINMDAAQSKRITSEVAGRADILVVPDLEAGNILAKQLQYLAGAESAGIVLGAKVPIILTSRADSIRSRLASAAVLKLLASAKNATGPSA